ncbi:VOC family protein [Nesterenkonia ebinurensis]|uniref:VOC family protein n=1 Tax=Nesterenkonia ebinurensis TaxID=2608252 RepID=UPI00123C8ACE|nr:hypothetical protein [Nesterenkonia ebinurensis]
MNYHEWETTVKIDHFALEVPNFDQLIGSLTHLGLTLQRVGCKADDSSRRIAMIRDKSGFKIEIIEGENIEFSHFAVKVESINELHKRLVTESNYNEVKSLRRLSAAKAYTSLVADPSGLMVQLVRYDPDSPDL